MAKATDTQIKNAKTAMAEGASLPKGVRINFGDAEPIQKVDVEKSTDQKSPDQKPADK